MVPKSWCLFLLNLGCLCNHQGVQESDGDYGHPSKDSFPHRRRPERRIETENEFLLFYKHVLKNHSYLVELSYPQSL